MRKSIRSVALTYLSSTLLGCTFNFQLADLAQTSDAEKISGSVLAFASPPSPLSKMSACTNASISLHLVKGDGTLEDKHLASGSVTDGKFELRKPRDIPSNLSTSKVGYVLKAEGCDRTFYRPLTKLAEQDITTTSTLVTLAGTDSTNPNKKLNSLRTEEVETALRQLEILNQASSLTETAKAISDDVQRAQLFSEITGLPAVKLPELPPAEIKIVAEAHVEEGKTSEYKVTVRHWNGAYQTAYLWTLNGQEVSSTETFNFHPNHNAQGQYALNLKVGAQDPAGELDLTKAFKEYSLSVTVENNFPPQPPSFTVQGSTLTKEAEVSLVLNTGENFANCASITALAVTETPLAPANFTLTCTTETSQSHVYTLQDLSDGTKDIYLWGQDAAGNISPPKKISITRDTAGPITLFTSAPTEIMNSSSASISFLGTDAAGISAYQCRLNSGTYSTCTSPLNLAALSEGPNTLYVRALDSLGNLGAETSTTWTVDTVAPNLTITSPASNGSLISTSLLAAFAVSGTCENGPKLVFSGAYTGEADCSNNAWNLPLNLSSFTDGTHTLTISQTDAAGNVSTTQRSFKKDTEGPVLAFTNNLSLPLKGGSTLPVQISVTENHFTTSTPIAIYYSIDGGTGWTSAGSIAGINGPLNAQLFNHVVNLPAVNTAHAKIRAVASDSAGNPTTITSPDFKIDSLPPVVSSMTVNDGATSTSYTFLKIKVNGHDALDEISHVRFSDTSSASDCQAQYANSNWYPWTGPDQEVSYNMSSIDGDRKICAWAKDRAGNVSTISPTTGTPGTDAYVISYFVGNPPVITSFKVENASGGTTFSPNDPVYVSWTITDVEGLHNSPVELSVSVNGGVYTPIVSNYGSLVGNPKTYTGSYNLFLAPSTPFRFKLSAIDMNGNSSVTALSNMFNIGDWTIYAGSTEYGLGGSGPSVTMNKAAYGISGNQFAMNPINGDIYAISVDRGVYKLSSSTGKTSIFIPHGSSNFGTQTDLTKLTAITSFMAINFDKKGRLYVSNPAGVGSNNGNSVIIWQIDFEKGTVSKYVGGGSLPGTSNTPPTPLTAHSTVGSFDFDDLGNLYFFSNCDPSTYVPSTNSLRYRLLKLTQNPDGTAGDISIIAGDCSANNPQNGHPALSNGLGTLAYQHIRQITTNWDGSLIYINENTPLHATYKLVYNATSSAYDYYTTAIGNRGIVFDRASNIVYSGSANIVRHQVAADPRNPEISLGTYVSANGTGDCNSDGVLAANACINAYGSNGIAPLEIANDGSLLFTDTLFRIRYLDSESRLRTLMGTKSFYGDGLDRLLARGDFRGIHYKTSNLNTADFPKGLYFLDQPSAILGHIDPLTGKISVVAGNQQGSGDAPAEGAVVNNTTNLGHTNNANFEGLTFDDNGLPIFVAANTLLRINPGKTISRVIQKGSGKQWYLADDGTLTTTGTVNISNRFGINNLVMLDGDKVYALGVNTHAPDGALSGGIGFLDLTLKKLSFLMKGISIAGTTTASPDSSVPSVVRASSLSGACPQQACFLQKHPLNTNLYFSEDDKIRRLSNPENPALVTLDSPAELNLGRAVRNFAFSPNGERVYYISSGGKLYCKWLAGGTAPSNCQNTDLGPHASVGNIQHSANQMTFAEDGKLFIASRLQILQYTYQP